MTNASDTQIGGTHYVDMSIQPWDFLKVCLTADEWRGYHKGVAIAYLARERAKGGIQDVRKAVHHLQKFLEDVPVDGPQIEPETVTTESQVVEDKRIGLTLQEAVQALVDKRASRISRPHYGEFWIDDYSLRRSDFGEPLHPFVDALLATDWYLID